jgi:hypothetical protein
MQRAEEIKNASFGFEGSYVGPLVEPYRQAAADVVNGYANALALVKTLVY